MLQTTTVMITSSFLHLPLLVALAQASRLPTCTPRPPPNFLPSTPDCLSLAEAIGRIAEMQGNLPQVWSQYPVAPGQGVQLPHAFVMEGNNCEVLVAMASDNAGDTFPTRLIYNAALDVVISCLFNVRAMESTVGYVSVGARKRILVYIRRYFGPQIITGKNNTALAFNGTELAVMEVGLGSGANLTAA